MTGAILKTYKQPVTVPEVHTQTKMILGQEIQTGISGATKHLIKYVL